MPREHLERELDRLICGTAALGWEVESSLALMVLTLEDHDGRTAARQLGDDAKFRSWAAGLDRGCLLLQACQAPVARDLRLLHAARVVTDHLVRAGTLCEHVFRAIADTPGERGTGDLDRVILRMSRAAHELFRDGLATFEGRDPHRARDLRAADAGVDLLYREAINLASSPATGEDASAEWRARIPLVVHYLERIADRGVEIGELAVFVVEGERVRSAENRRRSGRSEG
jgi:phosphate transport system protein